MTAGRPHVSRPVRALAALAAAFTLAALVTAVLPAQAATFTNSATITLPDPNCTDPDAAMPYPSNIAVALAGTVTDVNVTLNSVTHPFQGDIDVLLVAPGGTKLELLSDAGTGSLSNATVTFDDAAAGVAPQNVAWAPGTYKPSNYTELTGPDTFPAPAPAGPYSNTTLGAFDGLTASGTWSLYVTDDACPDAGSIGGGWTLNITASAGLTNTTTTVGSSLNPSRTGNSVTFTSTTLASGVPVTTGNVTFTEGVTVLAANVAVNASGKASFMTSSLTEGNHIVVATYNANATFNTSNGSVDQRVDNNTTVTGAMYCNTGPVAINDNTTATPYPSNVFVTGAPTYVSKATLTLKNITHTFNGDIEAMLVGPAGQNLVLVSDAGTAGVSNVTLNVDDAAASLLPSSGTWAAPNSTITRLPTNYNEMGVPDTYPSPAPVPSAATALSTFNGSNPNGTWSLYVKDDGAPDTGSIAGGWCINFTFDTTTATCSYTIVTSAPKHIDFTVQDTGTGLKLVSFPTLVNIVTPVPVPAFVQGTTAAVSFTATKNVQGLGSRIAVVITDMAGNQSSCI